MTLTETRLYRGGTGLTLDSVKGFVICKNLWVKPLIHFRWEGACSGDWSCVHGSFHWQHTQVWLTGLRRPWMNWRNFSAGLNNPVSPVSLEIGSILDDSAPHDFPVILILMTPRALNVVRRDARTWSSQWEIQTFSPWIFIFVLSFPTVQLNSFIRPLPLQWPLLFKPTTQVCDNFWIGLWASIPSRSFNTLFKTNFGKLAFVPPRILWNSHVESFNFHGSRWFLFFHYTIPGCVSKLKFLTPSHYTNIEHINHGLGLWRRKVVILNLFFLCPPVIEAISTYV